MKKTALLDKTHRLNVSFQIKFTHSFLMALVIGLSQVALASAPKVGRAAAARYFENERRNGGRSSSTPRGPVFYTPSDSYEAYGVQEPSSAVPSRKTAGVPAPRAVANEENYQGSSNSFVSEDHYMSLGFGTYSGSSAFNWGQGGREDDVAKWGVDLSYRMLEQEYLFDQSLRLSYNEFEVISQKTTKLSFMYMITFPEATSKFPLYFGGSAGFGVFMQQLKDESALTLDYQLFLGLRIFNVFDSVGLYVEGGLRNHLQLTSDGQLNGTFLSLGTVFTF